MFFNHPGRPNRPIRDLATLRCGGDFYKTLHAVSKLSRG